MFTVTKKFSKDVFYVTKADAYVKAKFKENVNNIKDWKKRFVIVEKKKMDKVTFFRVLLPIVKCLRPLLKGG